MADIISRLRLESGEFDSKIKRAGQELMAYSEHCRKTGLQMGFSNKDARDFAQSLGNMQTTSTTARGKINELSDAFVNLRMMYKQMTDEEKNNQFGKNLAASLDQLKTRIQDEKKDLSDVTAELNGTSSGGKGGFLSGLGDKTSGMLQVFGGNLLAEGVSRLTSELAGSVQQSIELARQGEGVRMAFERLDQPGLLDSLKEATHGTISELELMKQAVKFENFKLPVEDLANYLAFAQQKAKDTGESIDYLVNSITTGLGRQSKQILDNLGISAAELTRRMNEGATMTQAVSDIIREEMAKAGDYVETAADRAARAAADTQNKMEELGRSAMPVAEEFASAWAEIRNGAMSLVLPVLSTVADSIRDIREILGGEWDMPKLKPGIQNLADGPAKSNQPKKPTWGDVPVVKAPGGYVEVTDQSGKVLHGGHYDSDAQLQNMMKRWNTLTSATGGTRRTSSPSRQQTEMQKNQAEIAKLTQEYVRLGDSETEASRQRQAEIQKEIQLLEKRNGLLGLYQEQAQGRLMGVDVMTGGLSRNGGFTGFATPPSMSDVVRQRGGNLLDDKATKALNKEEKRNEKKEDKEQKSVVEGIDQLNGGINNIFGGLEQIGIEIPTELKSIFGVVQGVTTILMGIASTVIAIEALVGADTFLPFANGGIVGKAAGGMLIPGNSFSGDNLRMPVVGGGMIGVNSGEVILNRAQAGVIASDLQGSGIQNLHLDAEIGAEKIRLVLNNRGRRTGKGEYVQSTRRR